MFNPQTPSGEKPELISSAPDEAEMATRIARVRRRMAAEDLDAYVVHCPDNIFYLTNFANYVHERPFLLVVTKRGPLGFIVPQLEAAHVRIRSVGPLDLFVYFEFPSPPSEAWSAKLREALQAAKRVGVESSCPLSVYQEIEQPRVASELIEEVRFVKTPYEIGRIAHAADVVSKGHAELLAGAKPGEMILGLYAAVSRSMTVRMLGDMPHANMLASSFAALAQPPSVSHDPHNFTDIFAQMEEGGPHVTVVNCRVNGYGAEVERSFFLNTVPDEAARRFDTMLEARRIAFEMLRPGANMAGIDQAVRDFFQGKGCLSNTLHRSGHSFGVTGHEAPFLAVGYERSVEEGMLFSIEPGIYFEGLGGFRFSDTVLVTAEGNVCLTEAPETIEELTLRR